MQVYGKSCKMPLDEEDNSKNPKKCHECSRDQQMACWGFTED